VGPDPAASPDLRFRRRAKEGTANDNQDTRFQLFSLYFIAAAEEMERQRETNPT
jgi:hypothetical protein